MRLEPVRDPDSDITRLEHFYVSLPIWWRIRDDAGHDYTADRGGYEGPEGERWRIRFRWGPVPPPTVEDLILTLSEIRPYEDVIEREIDTVRVPLRST